MKAVACCLMALGLMAAIPTEADAAACARGAYHSGCVGPRGAVVTPRGYARPYGYRGYGYHPYYRPAYGPRCVWRGGVRICR